MGQFTDKLVAFVTGEVRVLDGGWTAFGYYQWGKS